MVKGKKKFRVEMEIGKDDFRRLLKYFYRGYFELPKEKEEVKWLKIAQNFKINELRSNMLALLGTYLTPQDACRILEETLRKKQFHLYEVCVKLIECYDDIIFVNTKEYMNFSVDSMLHFVKFGKLSISEMDIFKCVLKYCLEKYKENKFSSAKEFFKEKFEDAIKYPLIKPENLYEKVEKIEWVDEKYLLEAYRFHGISEKLRANYITPRSKMRGYSSVGKFKGTTILNAKLQIMLYKYYLEDKPLKKNWGLLYKASKDGFPSSNFHSKCDNKGPTLTVVESNCGSIFGGYTSLAWTNSSRYFPDPKAWLFHLYSKAKGIDAYKMKGKPGSQNHVYHYFTYGPVFGGNFDFYLSPDPKTQTCYSNIGHSYVLPPGKSQYITPNRNFTVKDYEVFGIK